jgi:hypothetical protein
VYGESRIFKGRVGESTRDRLSQETEEGGYNRNEIMEVLTISDNG